MRFAQEADEILEHLEQTLMQIENSARADDIAEAFRLIHSFKGNCGFMGLGDLERLSHAMENTLACLKDGSLEAGETNISVLLGLVDVLKNAVAALGENESGKIDNLEIYIEIVESVTPQAAIKPIAPRAEPAPKPSASSAPAPGATAEKTPTRPAAAALPPAETYPPLSVLAVDDEPSVIEVLKATLAHFNCQVEGFYEGKEALERLGEGKRFDLMMTDIMMPEMDGVQLIEKARQLRPDLPILAITAYGEKHLLEKLIDLGVDQYVEKPFPPPPDLYAKLAKTVERGHKRQSGGSIKSEALKNAKTVARQDIRVDLGKLDSLINLVGELVIAEAMVTRHPRISGLEDEGLERSIHLLRRVSRDLQDVAMSVRMVPLSATFRKMIRLVHDLATKSGKKINLRLLGEETEVDKTVIEQIADPLVHIVRNACDHGIGTPEDRQAADKPDTGTITIEGRHEGGEVWIIISDDGRGLNREKILRKAVEKGLVEGDGSGLSDDDAYALIFEPGFSTADQVTDISGRGVGMDVVKKNIEALKGRVSVRSRPGRGTTIILHIPLTLAIIEGMLVRVGRQRYTIPLLSIRESFRPEAGQVTLTPEKQEIVRVREELLPVLRLHEVFDKQPDCTELHEGILVVVESDGETFCVFADEILGQQETVIKGLSRFLGAARGVSGCTILGDGDVSLILDIGTLLTMVEQVDS